ncbi:DUF1302 domain-containing protein [Zestomonas carbonaria]|uniref:DUF1302 domain-containing protein n=1 Tax=Zestomonas carbonaria TaxID=2762745 RepID=A0A7U7EQK3_9GAMM|nr:DUF1302 domain-containing protein [Pseudomonas carbonaria]CAD5109379.1 hypothetical protein PSEWESI4_03676 [Pseudomonas carbonaria]
MTRITSAQAGFARHALGRAVLLGMLGGTAGYAQAFNFETESGWSGSLDTTLSLGSSWRAEARDNELYSRLDGQVIGKNDGLGGSNTDGGNLNYDRGDRFSTIAKILTEFEMSKGEMGGLLRIKGWYDQALEDEDVYFGNQANGYRRKPLSDDGFEDLQKNKGVFLLDAYVYDTYYLADRPLQVRLGRQVVNWGESLFVQGVNQINPLDVPSLRRPGTEIKEALLPVWMISGNFGLSEGLSLEAFYQFKWEPTAIEGCGNYWSVTETIISTHPGGCTMATSLPNVSNPVGFRSGSSLPLSKGKDAKDSGQWGLALRYLVESIDTEVGLYAMNIHARTPNVSAQSGNWGAIPVGVAGRGAPFINPIQLHQDLPFGATSTSAFWEYPENIRLYGLSAATTLAGWSVGAELSYSPNVPVQRNGNDVLAAVLQGVGPVGAQAVALGQDAYLRGYDRFEKTQLQINGINLFSNVLGASSLQVAAEIAFQWNDVPQGDDDIRYGRAFIFGNGSHPTYGGNTCGARNPQPSGCKDQGYITDFAWGYRVRGQLEYPDLFGIGVATYPSLFIGQDIDGVSLDGQFNEGRFTVGTGVRFDYLKKHSLEFNYVTFNNDAEYDPLRDRDYYSVNYSYKF